MTFENALAEVKKFWINDKSFPFGQSDNSVHVDRIKTEFGVFIPDKVQDYVKNIASLKNFYFDTVGNPMCVYGINNLKYKQDGYNYNPVKKEPIENWNKNFFIFADEGADPVIIDFTEIDDGIQQLIHGTGSWDNGKIVADTFGQFLLCCAAQHHALNYFEDEPIIDDSNGFNLADNAAKWYFRNMKNWAGDYYEEWCSIFDNC
jgi:hypothetical protein